MGANRPGGERTSIACPTAGSCRRFETGYTTRSYPAKFLLGNLLGGLDSSEMGFENPEATLWWRSLGEGDFRRVPLSHIARAVYRAEIPGVQLPGIVEYYVEARDSTRAMCYPAPAPTFGLTTVVAD